MKVLFFTIVALFILTNICRSQIPDSYPFRTYMDANNNLYMTGDSAGEIITTKFNLDLSFNWSKVFHNPGFDRGMDIVSIIDPSEVTYVAGYKFDKNSNISEDNNTQLYIRWSN